MGLGVPVVILERRTFSVVGDKLKKLIRIQSTDLGDFNFQKRYHDFSLSLRTFAGPKGIMEHYFLPSNTDIDIIYQTYLFAKKFNFHLTAASFARSPSVITGYTMSRSLSVDLRDIDPIHPRALFTLVRGAQTRTPIFNPPLMFSSSIEELECSLREAINFALSLFIGNMAACVAISFIEIDLNITARSHITEDDSHLLHNIDIWWWIFFRTVILAKLPPCYEQSVAEAAKEVLTAHLINDNTWSYTFFGEPDRIYWWRAGRRLITLITAPNTKSLSLLRIALRDSFPIIDYLTEVLPAVYRKSQFLNWHQDKTGRRYFGTHEIVQFFFYGQPRELKFKPDFLSFTQQRKMVINILCSKNVTLRLTAMGNTFFKHSKARSHSMSPSVTLAFRRGVPIHSAKALYPHIREFQNL